jgi:hypothetical protein
MQNLKAILMMSAVFATSAAATMNSAEARHYRHVAVDSDYVVSAASCSVLPPPTLSFYPGAFNFPNGYAYPVPYIYPAANWEPFFRRHAYRYGPVLTCLPSIETAHVISVRY